jgi:integrase
MASEKDRVLSGRAIQETSKDGVAERVYRRQDGTTRSEYSVRYAAEGGKRVRAVFQARSEALEFKAALAYARRHGLQLPAPPQDMRPSVTPDTSLLARPTDAPTLRAFVRNDYWPRYAQEELERTTLESYAHAWHKHIDPYLGAEALSSIGPKRVNEWLSDRRAAGVGPEALLKARTLLSGIFSYAVEEEILAANPVRQLRARRSKRSRRTQKRKRAVRPPGPSTIEVIRASMLAKDRVVGATLVSLLAYAGPRPGEALALRWTDILEQTILIEDGSDDGQPKALKNGIPFRSVDLVAPLREDLESLRSHLGVGKASETPVIPNAEGAQWDDEQYKRWRARHYVPAAIAAGLERPRPYDLRHAFVSLRILEGRLSLDEIARQAGHTVETALRNYRHVVDEYRGRRMPSMENAIRAARRDASPVAYVAIGLDRRKNPRR